MKSKLILTSFAILFGFEIAIAQPPLPGPVSKSDSLRNAGDIPGAIAECRKVYAQNPKDHVNLYNYARVLSINRQVDSSFKYLNLAVDMEPSPEALLEPDFLAIRKDIRWKDVENKLIARLNSKTGELIKDTAYAKVLWKLRAYDQAYFLETGIAGRNLGFKSSVVEALWDLKFLVNEKNQEELENWINKKGWPRISEVGSDAAFTAWLIIMHSNASMQRKYLPAIKKICEQNELPWARYASMYDRCMFNEKKPQRYGTQSWYNEQTGKYELYLLEDESRVNEWRKEVGLEPLPGASESDEQALFDAIKAGDLTRVKPMIEKDQALVKRADESGNSPVHQAVLAGSAVIIDFLLSQGADINAANTQGSTPLHLAIANRNDEMAKYLVNKGADLTRRDARRNTPLHATVYTNRSEVARLLIEKGADIEAKGFMDMTPLGALTRSTHSFEVAEVLVNHGADVNVPWTDGDRPLNYAAMYSDNRVIDLLLDHNADFDTTGEHLVYTMLSAIEKGHVRFFNKIMEKCGERLFTNAEMNQYMMRTAITSNATEIVRILQSKNIPLELSAGFTGATPLHTIADNPGALEMAELLVKNGLDINARTNDGRSAFNIAETSGNKEMQDLLLKLGANTDPQKFPELAGPYMGQAPPEKTPKRFAPGIVYADHATMSVSPDGNEMYWGNGHSIMCSRIQNGHWTKPGLVSFSKLNEQMFYDDVPFVTPDNKRLFFTSKRPVDSLSKNSTKENIWFVERTDDGWSSPKPVSAEVNALSLHWQVSVSGSGTLYFGGTDQFSLGSSDIYFSKLVDGKYTKPVNAGPVINSVDGESMPFIAPDESYLIFYRVVMQRPSLYISFRMKDGQWSHPQLIDKFQPYNCGIVTPDGKYFFMDSRWVSADFIEEMRPKVDSCMVTYIANEGFLIETKGHKVIVDALFGKISGDWCDQPGDSVLELMIKGMPPFDKIDLALVSHHHADHFNSTMLTEFLRNNRGTKVICTNRVNEMLATIPGYEAISGRINALSPTVPLDSVLCFGKLTVKALSLGHGSYFENDSLGNRVDLHRNVQNMGYLVSMDGFLVFHSGDASPSTNPELYKKYGIGDLDLDVAMLDRVFLSREGQQMLGETIHAGNIIYMHLESSKKGYFKTYLSPIPSWHVFQNSLEKLVLAKTTLM